MKVLIINSGTSGKVSPFVLAQSESIKRAGVDISYWSVQSKGIIGYLSGYIKMKRAIEEIKPDIIHAHYGFPGLLANLQRKVPVITTYHGSDINIKNNRKYSYLSSVLSAENIFVHPALPGKIGYKRELNIIPVGVNLETFFPQNHREARQKLSFDSREKYILFSSRFDNPVKNYSLAKSAVDSLDEGYQLIEMKGYSPEQLSLLYNAVDTLLVTSFSETGPLVVKEAMACNTPVVSVDVGDVKSISEGVPGIYIADNNANMVSDALEIAIHFRNEHIYTQGRDRIQGLGLDDKTIAEKIINIYKKTIKRKGMKG